MSVATEMVLSIMGQDKTAAAFSSVATRAGKASSSLKKALGFAVAGLSVAGIAAAAKSAVNSMGNIADAAQKVGVSSEYLQKLSLSLDQVGIKGAADVDTLASAFAKMAKNTGATGAMGFESTLASISAIGDESTRIQKLADVFGKELGANLAPLVRQGPDAFKDGLRGVMAAMPATTNKAIEMGDAISDGLKLASMQAKAAWQQTLGNMAAGLEKYFGMPIGEIMVTFLANVRWAFGTAWLVIKTFFGNVYKVIQFFRDDWKGAMEWVFNGWVGYWKACFQFWVQWYKSLATMVGSLGKEIWKALKGEGFDFSNISKDATAEFEKVISAGKDVFKSLIPSSNDKIKFDVIDWDAQFKKRDEMINTAREGVRAQSKLATGSVIESEAKDAVKSIHEAMRNATFTEAGTNDALKLIMSNRNSAGMGAAIQGAAGRAGAVYGAQRSASESTQTTLMQRLIDVAGKIETALRDIRGDVQKVEVV